MADKLVIVESPAKARTIQKYLGPGYRVEASMGHVRDLPKSDLGVDVDSGFAPVYEVSKGKEKVVASLKKSIRAADAVYLATDPDREGEAIAWHITQAAGIPRNIPVYRVEFSEITRNAVQQAIAHPRQIDRNLVDAQQARRVLDRLVGYKLSPLLWEKVRRGLSAGRVQSVALRLIVEREREIGKFNKKNYWTIEVMLLKGSNETKETDGTSFELVEINGERIELQESFNLYDGVYKTTKTIIDLQEKADSIVADLNTKIFTVADVLQKETKRSPQPPFTTSTLQQQAAQRYGYSGKRTMSLAQKLYEEGFITYHRTDSVTLASSAVSKMRQYIEKTYGKEYIPEKPRFYAARQKLAQEAHEAIRPTNMAKSVDEVNAELGGLYAKLYDLIWRRALSSQMSDARIESTTVFVDATNKIQDSGFKIQENGSTSSPNNFSLSESAVADKSKGKEYRFKTTGSVLLFDGFLRVNPFGLQDKKLPRFVSKERLSLLNAFAEKHETPPPPRYNDASLIGSLEEAGVGRPSTYASIISTIETRNYIEREEKKFIPTSVGMAVNDFLVKNFSDIDDIPFTARMEDELDAIANEGHAWVPMIRDFYLPFEKKLELVKKADREEI